MNEKSKIILELVRKYLEVWVGECSPESEDIANHLTDCGLSNVKVKEITYFHHFVSFTIGAEGFMVEVKSN